MKNKVVQTESPKVLKVFESPILCRQFVDGLSLSTLSPLPILAVHRCQSISDALFFSLQPPQLQAKRVTQVTHYTYPTHIYTYLHIQSHPAKPQADSKSNRRNTKREVLEVLEVLTSFLSLESFSPALKVLKKLFRNSSLLTSA